MLRGGPGLLPGERALLIARRRGLEEQLVNQDLGKEKREALLGSIAEVNQVLEGDIEKDDLDDLRSETVKRVAESLLRRLSDVFWNFINTLVAAFGGVVGGYWATRYQLRRDRQRGPGTPAPSSQPSSGGRKETSGRGGEDSKGAGEASENADQTALKGGGIGLNRALVRAGMGVDRYSSDDLLNMQIADACCSASYVTSRK